MAESRDPTTDDRLTYLLLWAASLISLYFICAYIYIAAFTLNYPYQMEWLEGGALSSVQRIIDGLPIYDKPTLEYLPFLYTPFYYYATAAITPLFGVGLLSGRLVSFGATIAIVIILYQWLRRENTGRLFALIPCGLFLATYDISGRWFHLVRVDMLFIALTFGGLFAYLHFTRPLSAVISGLLMSLAFMTKQQAVGIVLVPLLLGLYTSPTRATITLVSFIMPTALAIASYDYFSDGWFNLYTFLVPAQDGMDYHKIELFWRNDILNNLVILAVLAFIPLCLSINNPQRRWFYAGLLASTMAMCLASRAHVGGYINVVIPAYVVLYLIGGLGAWQAMRRWPQYTHILLLLLIGQLVLLAYNPLHMLPTKENYAAGKRYMEYIGALEGDIFIDNMTFIQRQVGKIPYSIMAFNAAKAEDFRLSPPPHKLSDQLRSAIINKKFSALILTRPNKLGYKDKYYVFKERILDDKNTYLITGNKQFLPNLVYVPIDKDPEETPR